MEREPKRCRRFRGMRVNLAVPAHFARLPETADRLSRTSSDRSRLTARIDDNVGFEVEDALEFAHRSFCPRCCSVFSLFVLHGSDPRSEEAASPLFCYRYLT